MMATQGPRLFVSEFLSGGGWPHSELPPSLLAEGLQMLVAVVEDFLAIGWHVATTVDARVSTFPIEHPRLTVRVIPNSSLRTHLEAQAFDELVHCCDVALVIAPEFHGHLSRRTRRIEELSQANPHRLRLGCSSSAVEGCADKLWLSDHLTAVGIRTIPTQSFDAHALLLSGNFPVVIKPRDGAGSTLTFRVNSEADLDRAIAEISSSDLHLEFIQQPFVSGQTFAMSSLNGRCLPLTEQLLSQDGRFHYLGSRLSTAHSPDFQAACEALVADCHAAIPGLRGYVGFDLIRPDSDPQHPLLVEINPRLTSSYLTYRESRSDLASLWSGVSE